MKDDVDSFVSNELLNALVTKSVANVVSNEDVKLFIEILYVVLPEIPTTKVVSNDAGLNAGNSDIFLVCLSAIFIILFLRHFQLIKLCLILFLLVYLLTYP